MDVDKDEIDLKSIRERYDYTQEEFADKIGITRELYGQMERGVKNISKASKILIDNFLKDNKVPKSGTETYIQKRRTAKAGNQITDLGIPVYDIPIDASFLERYRDDGPNYEPVGFLNIPKLRNCNFAAIISGNSMYPILKSGTIAACRMVDNLDYFDEGEMYFISTTNGFETVKYVQSGDKPDELKLIPHNEKIKATIIKKNMVIRICIVEAWLNFR